LEIINPTLFGRKKGLNKQIGKNSCIPPTNAFVSRRLAICRSGNVSALLPVGPSSKGVGPSREATGTGGRARSSSCLPKREREIIYTQTAKTAASTGEKERQSERQLTGARARSGAEPSAVARDEVSNQNNKRNTGLRVKRRGCANYT